MTWYHGTSVEAAQAILANGFIGRAERGRAYLAPLPGRAYLSQRLPFALSYSFGGLVEADGGGWRVHGRNPVGAVLAVEPALETCTPDEDWLGQYLVNVDRLDGQPELRRAVRAVMSYIPARTRNGWAQIRDRREYAVWARTGKTAINHLLKTAGGREVLAWLTALAPEIACVDRTVRVLGAWRLTREQVPQLAPDGSNLDLIGVPIQPAGGLAGRRVEGALAGSTLPVLQENHAPWYHVTHPSHLESILANGLNPQPKERTYQEGFYASLGGIYVVAKKLLPAITRAIQIEYGTSGVTILTLQLNAGTPFCLDEDEITDWHDEDRSQQIVKPGVTRDLFIAAVDATVPEHHVWEFDKARGKMVITQTLLVSNKERRDLLDKWSCRLAHDINQSQLEHWRLRVFAAPKILDVTQL